LSTLSILDLVVFHDASVVAAGAWMAISNQPRCNDGKISGMIDDKADRARGLTDLAISELVSRAPRDEHEAKIHAQCILDVPAKSFRGPRQCNWS
jgi:hypothetical protein